MTDHEPTPRPAPRPQPRVVLCPYCGSRSRDPHRCESCAGYFDPLSRQATQNAMGPWFIRDDAQPFRPGCSFETLRTLIRRGRITPETPLRGPTTRQFWVLARRCPAVANLLGICHACAHPVEPRDRACRHCGVSFEPPPDRQQLGLGSVRLLPGHATPEDVAAMTDVPPQSLAAVAEPAGRHEQPEVAEIASAPDTPDPAILARVTTLERNLRVLRRSRAIYLATAILLLLASAFVFAAPSLGVGLGPIDRWLGRAHAERRELAEPGLGSAVPVPAHPTPIPPPASTTPRDRHPPPDNDGSPGRTPGTPDLTDDQQAAQSAPQPSALRRLEELARSGRPEDLAPADRIAQRAIEDGCPPEEASRLQDALRLRLAWHSLRTFP